MEKNRNNNNNNKCPSGRKKKIEGGIFIYLSDPPTL